MDSAKLLAVVLGGVALAACGGSTKSGSSSAGDGGAGKDGGGSSSGSSSSSGGSSSGSGSSSGGASSSSGSSSGASGFAIPLSAPGGADFEYTAKGTVGNQTFVMSIDTGSTTLALGGTGCSSCTGVSPLYSPSSSAKATGQMASEQYADGSAWSGPVYSDSVDLGNGSPSVSVELAEITQASQFFDGQNDYQGILGLGPLGNAVPGTTGYMPAVMMGTGLANIFAFALCDGTGANAGTMWLGGDGSPGSAVAYTPLIPISDNNPYYGINVDGVSLAGTTVVSNAASTFAQPVLDTGTSLFYVPTSVFNAFQTTLQASSGFKAVFGSNTFATGNGQNAGCVTDASATDAKVESMLPPITLSLPAMTSGQPDVIIQGSPLDTYLYDGGGGQFCLAIQDGGPSNQSPSTFGDAFLQAFTTIVDITGGRVGFAKTSCPTPAVRRVRHPAKTGPHRAPRAVLEP
jgi:hypothetical protein